MNGLKYHYANSGAHGAIGLALIAQGKHTHPKSAAGASLPGGDSNGFTPKASGSPLAVGGGSIGSAAPSVLGNTSGAGVGGGGGPMVWQPQQPGQGTLDEVLFTAGGEDVDMEM
jgi:transcription factor SFP1